MGSPVQLPSEIIISTFLTSLGKSFGDFEPAGTHLSNPGRNRAVLHGQKPGW